MHVHVHMESCALQSYIPSAHTQRTLSKQCIFVCKLQGCQSQWCVLLPPSATEVSWSPPDSTGAHEVLPGDQCGWSGGRPVPHCQTKDEDGHEQGGFVTGVVVRN